MVERGGGGLGPGPVKRIRREILKTKIRKSKCTCLHQPKKNTPNTVRLKNISIVCNDFSKKRT